MTVPSWISPLLIVEHIEINGESRSNVGYTKYLLDQYEKHLQREVTNDKETE